MSISRPLEQTHPVSHFDKDLDVYLMGFTNELIAKFYDANPDLHDLKLDQARARVGSDALSDAEQIITHQQFPHRPFSGDDDRLVSAWCWTPPLAILEEKNILDKVQKKCEEIWQRSLSIKPSGAFFYPPSGGYMGWHTNEDLPGFRAYFTYAEASNKAFFRYRDPKNNQIVTSWDPAGWSFRTFQVGDDNLTRLWHCVYAETARISIGFKLFPTEHKPPSLLRGCHAISLPSQDPEDIDGRDWTLDGRSAFISMSRVAPLLVGRQTQSLSFKDVCIRLKPACKKRLQTCDTSHPPIVVAGMSNPCDLPYRLIDGNHRMHKMIRAGRSRALFYVLTVNEALSLVELD